MAKTDKKLDIGSEWAKHLRPYLKRQFWKKVRQIAKQIDRKRTCRLED